MRKLTDEQIDRMIQMRESGSGYGAISTALGVSKGAIHYQCLKHGAFSPRQTGRRPATAARTYIGRDGRKFRPFTADEDQRMTELSIAGRPMDAIAREIGRPRTSVRIRLMTLAMHEELAS